MKERKKLNLRTKVLISMGAYALIFIIAAVCLLGWFWGYMESYEFSRPTTTMNAYVAQLKVSHLQDSAAELISQIDHNIQSEEACRQAIADAVKTDITYAKKVTECTETRLVYVLSCGRQAIGRVTLTQGEQDRFGYSPWVVESESFDFSFLMGEGTSITAPHDYPVYVNGTCLNETYITEAGLQYELLSAFYDNYSLPHMVTYTVAPIMGQLNVTITDPAGNPVSAEEVKNEAAVLNNCTAEEIAAIDGVIENFLVRYVAFTTNSKGDLQGNYSRLAKYMVPNSSLDQRMHNSFEGLKWIRDRIASMTSMTILHRVSLGDGRYLCDVTYNVKYQDSTLITDSVQIILLQTESGLLAETMLSY